VQDDMAWEVFATDQDDRPPRLSVGARVYVADKYLGNWCAGFEVAEVTDDGYRLRRLTDGRVFPDIFPLDDVREERRRDPFRMSQRHHPDRRLPPG